MSGDMLVLLLGPEPTWLRLENGRIISRGADAPTPLQPDVAPERRTIAVIPADRLIVHYAALPGLAEAQARAAARLLVAEQSASPVDDLHIAIGPESDDGERTIVAVERSEMTHHLAHLAALGFDPDVVVPAPLLLPRPTEGLISGDIGGTRLVRAHNSAFIDDSVLTPLLAGDAGVRHMSLAERDAAIVDALASLPINLRQGAFAPVRRWTVDWALVRRIAILGSALVVATILLQLVTVLKLGFAADRIEAANTVATRAALPPGSTVTNPLAQLDERLAALQGAGSGLLPLASATASAVNATSNVELVSMAFDGSGGLHILVRASSPTELDAVASRLASSGLAATPGANSVDQGRPLREFTVRAP